MEQQHLLVSLVILEILFATVLAKVDPPAQILVEHQVE
jgi:hypothetical protein